MRLLQWRTCRALFSVLALLVTAIILPGYGRADDAPVRVKRVEWPPEAPVRLAQNLNYAAVKHKWGLEAWWAVTTTRQNMYQKTTAGNGMFIALMSPELIAAVSDQQARSSHLSGEERQQLYSLNLRKYYGEPQVGCERIVFAGYIQIDQFAYTSLDVIDSDWTFTLSTDDGKTYAPAHITFSKFDYHDLNEEGTTLQRKAVTVSFDNVDPATHKPILTDDTPALTLELSGRYGAVKARFSFSHRRKH